MRSVSDSDSMSLKPFSLFVFEHEVYFTADRVDTNRGGLFKRSKFDDTARNAAEVILNDIALLSPMLLYQQAAKPEKQTPAGKNCILQSTSDFDVSEETSLSSKIHCDPSKN